MNPSLQLLQPYPFEKLSKLFAGITPPADRTQILWSIGEPKHPVPPAIAATLVESAGSLGSYPAIAGSAELRQAISSWICQRFLEAQAVDPEKHVLPVNGTREALFSFAQCVVSPEPDAVVVMPNPFYQIYEGAALLAGATPWFLNLAPENNYLPNLASVPDDVWRQCQLIYICTPGNPAGSVIPLDQLQELIRLADQYNFVIASDECYSELYFDEARPSIGLLQAAWQMGRKDFSRCVVFHSLSKRSSVPGLRSGFVAGDAEIIQRYRHYRTYHGCSMPPPVQSASITAWGDEEHVRENRALYREKFKAVLEILQPVNLAHEVKVLAARKDNSPPDTSASSQTGLDEKQLIPEYQIAKRLHATQPEGGFYLWAKVPGDDTKFARALYASENLVVLPGSYLSRVAHGSMPGYGFVRMALVAPLDQCVEGAKRLRSFVEGYECEDSDV